MSGSDTWRPNNRPMSTIALNFSAALDDLFQLGTIHELENVVEQKNREVETQKSQLEDLDARLRQADEKLKHLEIKHKRMSRHFAIRRPVQELFAPTNNSDTDDTDASKSEASEPAQS